MAKNRKICKLMESFFFQISNSFSNFWPKKRKYSTNNKAGFMQARLVRHLCWSARVLVLQYRLPISPYLKTHIPIEFPSNFHIFSNEGENDHGYQSTRHLGPSPSQAWSLGQEDWDPSSQRAGKTGDFKDSLWAHHQKGWNRWVSFCFGEVTSSNSPPVDHLCFFISWK